jgi:hypothetical protein
MMTVLDDILPDQQSDYCALCHLCSDNSGHTSSRRKTDRTHLSYNLIEQLLILSPNATLTGIHRHADTPLLTLTSN